LVIYLNQMVNVCNACGSLSVDLITPAPVTTGEYQETFDKIH
jgi:hypothetical protein